MIFDHFMDKTQHLAGLGMTLGLQFRVDQFPVHADLEAASVRGNEGYTFDLRLIILEQVTCQAHGPVGVVSNRAIDDFNFEHNGVLSKSKR